MRGFVLSCLDSILIVNTSLVLNQYQIFEDLFWQMRRTDQKNGTPSEARSLRLVENVLNFNIIKNLVNLII